MAQPGDRGALSRAYRDTTYRVYVPGQAPLDLHAGQRCSELDRLLARLGARDWAFITAWNPASRRLPGWANARRQRLLLGLLRGHLVLRGAGLPADAGWLPEESVFVANLPAGRARRLARCFGQNALLRGRRGRAAQLDWVR